jgi:hypothetical protein
MPYCARGGALRRPWGRWGCLTYGARGGARYAYGARGGRLTTSEGAPYRLTASEGVPYAYGVRGGALRLRRPWGRRRWRNTEFYFYLVDIA